MLGIEELFAALNKARVQYLLIGGLASIIYGVPRTTGDIDITVRASKRNVKSALEVLQGLGLIPEVDELDEILGLGGTTFENELKLDMLVDLEKKTFDRLWKNRVLVEFRGVRINVVSKKEHIAMLKKLGRPNDIEDLKYLED